MSVFLRLCVLIVSAPLVSSKTQSTPSEPCQYQSNLLWVISPWASFQHEGPASFSRPCLEKLSPLKFSAL